MRKSIEKPSKGSITPKQWNKITQELMALTSQIHTTKKGALETKSSQAGNGKR